jgi:RimJ/RimL family protein N-acetyltransferase
MEFTLRPWKPDDLPSLIKYGDNWNIAKNLSNLFPHPYTEDAGKAFIRFANADKPIHTFAIEVNGEAVGGIGIHPQTDIMEKNAELGYWLGEPFWGKGIVSGAVRQILNFAFDTYQIDRVYATVFRANIASQRLLEKNGFRLEANIEKLFWKKGEYHDGLIYAVRRDHWTINSKK